MINLTMIDWKAIDLTKVSMVQEWVVSNPISNWVISHPQMILVVFSLILLLKGLALYRAAGKRSAVWFWVLFVFNTCGILPLLYLIFSKRGE